MNDLLAVDVPPSSNTRHERKLIVASERIASSSPVGEDMMFTHSILCQIGLPRSRVKCDHFIRKSGAAWLSVQPGYLDEGGGPVLQEIPYGAMPRLALAWVSTYAKRHKTREVPIGKSASEFLRLLGKHASGGPRGNFGTLHTQMNALAACRLQLGFENRTFNGQPVEQFDAWLSDENCQRNSRWPGILILSEGYFQELVRFGVPLDGRAISALGGSTLALDAYTWLAHRLHRLDGKPMYLKWKSLREQFGQEYCGKHADKDFKKRFSKALHSALTVYPQAQSKVFQVNCGLILKWTPPPVHYRE